MKDEQELWQMWDNLAFTRLFQGFRLTIGPTKMTIAFLAVAVIALSGWVMDACVKTVVTGANVETSINGTAVEGPVVTELHAYLYGFPKMPLEYFDKTSGEAELKGVCSVLWNFNTARFNEAMVSMLKFDLLDVFDNVWQCIRSLIWAITFHTVYSIIYFAIVCLTLCICGGAICRAAALEFARGEKPGLAEAFRFSLKNLRNFVAAPAVPFGLVLSFGACVSLMGFIGNLKWAGELIMGLTLGISLVFGLICALALIGTVAGAFLLFPAIAYENSDGLDAISRAGMYVVTRPWRMIFYSSVSLVYGAFSYLFVRFFAFFLLIVTYSLLNFGVFNEPDSASKLERIWAKPQFYNLLGADSATQMNWSESISSFLIPLPLLLVVGLVAAYVISYYFSSSTVMYALMRKEVDNVEFNSVHVLLEDTSEQVDSAVQDV